MVEENKKGLKYLDFVQVAAICIVVCFSSLYEYAKENAGPLKPGVQTVEDTVRTVIGPVYDKFHDVPFELLKFVDRKLDESMGELEKHVPSLVKQASSKALIVVHKAPEVALAVASEVQRAGVVDTAKSVSRNVYTKYEPVAEYYAVLAWHSLNRLPLFPQVAHIVIPTASYWSEKVIIYSLNLLLRRSKVLMDSQEAEVEVEVGRTKRRGVAFAVLRCTLGLVFPFFLVFVALWFYVALSSSSSSTDSDSTISLPSQCKIVSSSVDLRSSQVCELGLLNYKAKNVFYPFHTNKFRCRYDYYWASVFKVEYKDHSSGQTQLAFAEAPNEALPLNCRPNFGAAWLTKDKFKVNRTYDCWYQSGISKVSLYHDGFFSCQAKDPSTIEMIRRYSILSIKILQSSFSSRGGAKFWRWEMIAGVVSGFSTSLITISFIRLIHQMKLWLPHIWSPRVLPQAVNSVHLKRAVFLVIYFSLVIWLAMQYGKRLGILEIFTALNS